MAEFKQEVKTYNVSYICDACGSHDENPIGTVLLSNPPQYPHVCKSCGKTYTFRKRYPTTEYIVVDNSI